MAADRTEVTQNRISENDSYGIVVVSLAAGPIAHGAQRRRRAQLGSHADRRQQYADNGRHPHPSFAKLLGAPAAICSGTAPVPATPGAKAAKLKARSPRICSDRRSVGPTILLCKPIHRQEVPNETLVEPHSVCLSRPWSRCCAALAVAEEEKYPQRDASAPAVGPQTVRGTFTVAPGQSIQAAVDRARPGDRIEVLPGTYNEIVTVDFDDIELVGLVQNGERPVLDGKGTMNDAVLASGNNFVITGFEIRDYKGNGVVVSQAKNATFKNLVCHNTGKYGVYPVLCQGVLVESCVVSDVWDAGVYAGQCQDVVDSELRRLSQHDRHRNRELRQRGDGQQFGPRQLAGPAGRAAARSAHHRGQQRPGDQQPRDRTTTIRTSRRRATWSAWSSRATASSSTPPTTPR